MLPKHVRYQAALHPEGTPQQAANDIIRNEMRAVNTTFSILLWPINERKVKSQRPPLISLTKQASDPMIQEQ